MHFAARPGYLANSVSGIFYRNHFTRCVPEGWSQAERRKNTATQTASRYFGRISPVLFIAGDDGHVPNDDFDPDRSFPMKMRFAGIRGIRLARPIANSLPPLDVRVAQRRTRGRS
jgi:hypothetical protein